jgi:hypothetical protein
MEGTKMSRLYALILASVGGWFVYAAIQLGGGISLTQLGPSTYYLTVAFIALLNAALFAAADFVEE